MYKLTIICNKIELCHNFVTQCNGFSPLMTTMLSPRWLFCCSADISL